MNIEFIRKAYHLLQDDNLCFVYQGRFTDTMTESVIGLNEYNLANKEDLKKLKKKVSLLMAESFQNVVRHGTKTFSEIQNDKYPSLFMTRSVDDFYYITSANMIDNKDVQSLESKLKKINELNSAELKELYIQSLSAGELSEKGGAGLGFIEMARKSGKKLDFAFEPLNEVYSMFYFRIKMQGRESNEKYFPLSLSKDFYSNMQSENILMVYKGDFSRDSILSALNLIKSNLEKTDASIASVKRIYHIALEMLQNISKHGYEREGIRNGMFSIGMSEGKYTIICANPVLKASTPHLQEIFVKLKSMNMEALKIEYKTALKYGKATNTGGAGLGLLDVVKESKGNFGYLFDPINEKCDLFLLSVTI